MPRLSPASSSRRTPVLAVLQVPDSVVPILTDDSEHHLARFHLVEKLIVEPPQPQTLFVDKDGVRTKRLAHILRQVKRSCFVRTMFAIADENGGHVSLTSSLASREGPPR